MDVIYRKPDIHDGQYIYRLIKNSPPLDLNSEYYYILWCSHFNDTSIIAEHDGTIKGFISGYIKPEDNTVLFIWQVVTDNIVRGKGIGIKMLQMLFERCKDKGVSYMETTVTPSNEASLALFNRFAVVNKTAMDVRDFISAKHFSENNHEEENLLRIGPI